jgi:hypothetical protein
MTAGIWFWFVQGETNYNGLRWDEGNSSMDGSWNAWNEQQDGINQGRTHKLSFDLGKQWYYKTQKVLWYVCFSYGNQ